jgi:hypothetical protein
MLTGHKYKLSVVMAAALVAGCGGGSTLETNATPQAAVSAAPQAAALLPGTSVTPDEAARQLMDYAEKTYQDLFPGHPATGSLAPFAYRAYPGDIYLGVVVTDGTAYTYGGVYAVGILGGTLAHPAYVGQLTSFITPVVTGGGGTGSANGCFDLSLSDTQGTHSVIGYTYSGTITGTQNVDSTVAGMSTFEGHSARETDVLTTGTNTTQGVTVAVNTSTKAYGVISGNALTSYGAVVTATGSTAGVNFTNTSRVVYSPPFTDAQFGLAIGQSVTQTQAGSLTGSTSFGGLIPDQTTPATTFSTTSTTTYVGQESVSVIAGTYNACEYQVTTPASSDVTTTWYIVGKGIPVKITTTGSANQTIQANSVVLNGAHL